MECPIVRGSHVACHRSAGWHASCGRSLPPALATLTRSIAGFVLVLSPKCGIDEPMPAGTVVGIFVASHAAEPLVSLAEVRAIPGKGLEGDRYFKASGTFSGNGGTGREVTLIESEALQALERDYEVALEPPAARRNLVTRGIALNHLVGREFHIGAV